MNVKKNLSDDMFFEPEERAKAQVLRKQVEGELQMWQQTAQFLKMMAANVKKKVRSAAECVPQSDFSYLIDGVMGFAE